ncbi:endoglucanase [Microbacterium sp. AK009]|uniref:glycoside hydrolase family 6 protein n=1 Tax=Microbacterium sp. AK009 TaxID=2723068 RepID=UPI00184512F0|nr:glycoside hydrolase family 6 protein [Microbacterium sp. AK009]NYF15384.1 endoglucanase [Microbacterium sp. AK009]
MVVAPAPVRRRRRGMPRWLIVAFVVLAASGLLAILAAIGWVATWGFQMLGARPPALGTTIVVPDESKAAKALETETPGTEEFAATEYLAAQPTAYWLTPEEDPIGEVFGRMTHLAEEARDQDASIAVVVYGLPGRDCGNFSAGGLDEPDYATWTEEIGAGLRAAGDLQKIVILEPDSLALAPECGNVTERVDQLRGVIDRLAGPNTWIYVDGGHSTWLPAEEMAGLISQLDRAGSIRGFATNVSNYNHASEEFVYARQLSGLLGGSKAVVDTSRSGAGSNGEWCNPRGRLIGEPGGTLADDVVDTNLWIKPPGESDGECNGGPAAGVWWPKAAIELTREVG